MEGHLLMSAKERRRKSVFDEVAAGRRTLKEASTLVGLSYRQTRRAYARFRQEGDAGLVHRSRGRPSNRGYPEALRRKVLRRYAERYEGMGPTFVCEKLAAQGYALDHETLRRWLLDAGHWHKRHKRSRHRSRRERKAHFGELVQLDGSHHAWFGSQRERYCLMNMVDDATGTSLSLLAKEETTEAAMVLLWRWVERYGVPQALYTDKKSVFVSDREPTLEEDLAGEEPKTAFGKACAKLGIVLIKAHSPQAKGRVERNHGVYQDRFVNELKLRRITTLERANRLLQDGFIQDLNTKFAKAPARDQDFHRPVPKGMDLADVFCLEEPRTVQKDWTLRYANRHYQILDTNRPLPKPKQKVLVRVRLDGTLHLVYRDKALDYRPIACDQVRRRAQKAAPHQERPAPSPPPKPRAKPAYDHPWRQACTLMAAETTK